MVAMLMSAPARAQGSGGGTGGTVTPTVVQSRVSGYTVQTGDWRLKPTIDPAAIGSTGQPGRVNSMIAVIRPEAAIGNNIRVIWFQRAANDSWSARAWTDADIGPALAYIKQHANFPDEDNDTITYGLLWPVAEVDDSGPNGIGPGVDAGGVPQNTNWMHAGAILGQGYANGFLQGDPMGQLVTILPDRDPVVALFTDSGYESADLVFERSRFTEGCTNDAAVQSYAATAEAFYVFQDLEAAVSIGHSQLTALCLAQAGGPPPCNKDTMQQAWGPYNCGTTSAWSLFKTRDYLLNGELRTQCVYRRSRTCTATFTRTWTDGQCNKTTMCQKTNTITEEEFAVCTNAAGSNGNCLGQPQCGTPNAPFKPTNEPKAPGSGPLPSVPTPNPTAPPPKPGTPTPVVPPPNPTNVNPPPTWPSTLPDGSPNPCP
jgi:hypothetical protein